MSTCLVRKELATWAPRLQPRVLLCRIPWGSSPSPARARLSHKQRSKGFQYRSSRAYPFQPAVQVRVCTKVRASDPQRLNAKVVQDSGAPDVVIRSACAEDSGALSNLLDSAGALWSEREVEVSITSCWSFAAILDQAAPMQGHSHLLQSKVRYVGSSAAGSQPSLACQHWQCKWQRKCWLHHSLDDCR